MLPWEHAQLPARCHSEEPTPALHFAGKILPCRSCFNSLALPLHQPAFLSELYSRAQGMVKLGTHCPPHTVSLITYQEEPCLQLSVPSLWEIKPKRRFTSKTLPLASCHMAKTVMQIICKISQVIIYHAEH